MSAANASVPTPSLQEEMRAHEPSMEEILASIRRIIADDETLASAGGAGRRRDEDAEPRRSLRDAYPAPALDPVPDFELPEPHEAGLRAQPPVTEIRRLRVNRAAPPPTADVLPEIEEYEEAAPVAALEPVLDEALLSTNAASSVASHFDALTTSLFINDSGLIERYAQEMLRPMLKQWLDDNLPVIVERLVRAEIERVARGGRR